MSDKSIEKLAQLARQLKEEATPELALSSLVAAGILTERKEFTEPYKHLGSIVSKTSGVRSAK